MALVSRSRFSRAARSRAGGAGGFAATGGAFSFGGTLDGVAAPGEGAGAGAGARAAGGGGAGAAGPGAAGVGAEAAGGGGAAATGVGASGFGEDTTAQFRDVAQPASPSAQPRTAIATAAGRTRLGTAPPPWTDPDLTPPMVPTRP